MTTTAFIVLMIKLFGPAATAMLGYDVSRAMHVLVWRMYRPFYVEGLWPEWVSLIMFGFVAILVVTGYVTTLMYITGIIGVVVYNIGRLVAK